MIESRFSNFASRARSCSFSFVNNSIIVFFSDSSFSMERDDANFDLFCSGFCAKVLTGAKYFLLDFIATGALEHPASIIANDNKTRIFFMVFLR